MNWYWYDKKRHNWYRSLLNRKNQAGDFTRGTIIFAFDKHVYNYKETVLSIVFGNFRAFIFLTPSMQDTLLQTSMSIWRTNEPTHVKIIISRELRGIAQMPTKQLSGCQTQS